MSSLPQSDKISLCTRCRDLIVERERWESRLRGEEHETDRRMGFLTHRCESSQDRSIESLEKDGTRGCKLCLNVWDEIITRDLLGNHNAGEGSLVIRPRLVRRLAQQSDREVQWSLEMILSDGEGLLDSVVGAHHFRPLVTSEPHQLNHPVLLANDSMKTTTQDLTIAKHWLRNCRDNHRLCQPIPNQNLEYPTRLVELWKSNQIIQARLIESDDAPLTVPYAALSHCWGDGVTYTLTSVRVSDFKKLISVDELAKTFKDAFEVVISLGLSHVWIDSLCIIQDSSADWNKECYKMASIYVNAAVTIAATAFSSSETGLFVTKSLGRSGILRIHADENIEDGIQHDYYLIHENAWAMRVDQAPLNQRGWVVQERFFSSRILHFGKDQLLWECQEEQAGESIPSLKEWPFRSNAREGYRPYRSLLFERDVSPPTLHNSNLMERQREHVKYVRQAWNRIVHTYTQSKLTHKSDRLLAIAGIISRFEALLDDKCRLGLWETCLLDDLLWHRQNGDTKRPDVSRAPSWTWACLDCGVTYERLGFGEALLTPCARVICFEDEHQRVRLVARVPRARLRESRDKSSGFSMKLRVNHKDFDAEVLFDAKDSDARGPYESRKGLSVYIICMYALEYLDSGGKVWKAESVGLVVMKATHPGQYRRIGYFVAAGGLWTECHPRDDAPHGFYTITLL